MLHWPRKLNGPHIQLLMLHFPVTLLSFETILELIGLWCTTGGAVDIWEFPDILYGPMGHEDLSKMARGQPQNAP